MPNAIGLPLVRARRRFTTVSRSDRIILVVLAVAVACWAVFALWLYTGFEF